MVVSSRFSSKAHAIAKGMESINVNEIIDAQTFSQQLVDETSEFITVRHQNHEVDSESESHGAVSMQMRTLIASNNDSRLAGNGDIDADVDASGVGVSEGEGVDEPNSSVVMVIDEMGHTNAVQTTYQIVPQQLHLQGRTVPLSLLPIHQQTHQQHQQQQQQQQQQQHHHQRHERLAASPVDFVGSDISLDGLTVSSTTAAQSQRLGHVVSVKQEHKLLIVHRDQAQGHHPDSDQEAIRIGRATIRNRQQLDMDMDMDVSNVTVGVIDELSSDGGGCVEEVTLNQHHQQLLEQQYGHGNGQRHAPTSEMLHEHSHHHHHHHHHHHQQHQHHTNHHQGLQHRPSQAQHHEELSIIVQSQQDDDDVDTVDADADPDDEEDEGESGGRSHLLSPALGVDNPLEHSFSPTSYATLTPIQPLPPISTMSDKFAYAGHISGDTGGGGNGSGEGGPSNSSGGGGSAISSGNLNSGGGASNDCSSFTHHQSSLGSLGLSGLGGVQSPYSSYDKLPSMISPPPHNYAGSPSHYESSYSGHHQDHELIMATSSSTSSTGGRNSQLGLQHSPTLSPHSVSAGSVVSMSLHSPASIVTLPHINGSGSVTSLTVAGASDLPVVVSLTPTPPSAQIINSECNSTNGLHPSNIANSNSSNLCNISQQQQLQLQQVPPHHQSQNGYSSDHHQQDAKITSPKSTTAVTPSANASPGTGTSSGAGGSNRSSDMEEINTKELAQRISAELKRYSIPQAIFAQRVLCRSQGTLSDLLRNPKPWSKLKSGRETFRRMFKWLQEPEFQRMSALRMAAAQIPQRAPVTPGPTTTSSSSTMPVGSVPSEGSPPMVGGGSSTISANTLLSGCGTASVTGVTATCRRKEESHIEQMPHPKKPRLVFTDLQRRTLQAIFKETKRPSKEMQVTIARQLGLEPTTVGNFFMNARRRSMDKWRDDDSKNSLHSHSRQQHQEQDQNQSSSMAHGNYGNLHTTAMSPLGAFDDDGDMDLELDNHDFDLVDDHGDDGVEQDDML
ncbi:homeobox protein onecut isoform X2 [Drosophila willistoni]|uniref:homeobox protein onecut isoform X2 n=1 Tax=Drosophila willistoni TaxID=7260 RepID=UPI000C26D64D|nr:homeobox protein onecut isoform X2 [Drosophila willistoni]